MDKNIELTERDVKLLKDLAELSVIKVENVNKIYESNAYYLKRLLDLKKAHYVRRLKGYVMLGVNGMKYAKEQGWEVKHAPSEHGQKERVQKISDLYYDFKGSEWTFIDSRKVKEQKKSLDRGSNFLGLLVGRTEYAIYNIGKRPDEKKITLIKKEQEKLHRIGIYRTIVFYEDSQAREMYGTEGIGLKEQLLLPYPYGIELVKKHGERDLVEEVAVKVYGKNLKEPDWKEADYTVDNKQVMVLVMNDVEKIAKIKNYFELAQYRYTRTEEIEILCLEEQEEMFREMFPECSIRTVEEV
ncbi:hypothetical protein [Thermoanaerobacterium sp. RBIITD]|uniref:hypothetical protein n=1 Tax=Thermoanaerobacterium sp. RBIITD TaxID=1550240 RepID=UPI000BB79D19|nr:hypothetical protein [Thermoanaerobacterium sp. RBIITD]SNX54149.1 hypothetical protein SAMN05660242_1782 [Thermoanaerobacterium sp. RBIITD]